MKGVCRTTGLWCSSFIAANSHFPLLPQWPRTGVFLVIHSEAVFDFEALNEADISFPCKTLGHLRKLFSPSAPQRETSVRLHYQMTLQPVHHPSANNKVCKRPTKIQASQQGQAKGINKPTKEKNRCAFKYSQLTCQVTLRLTCG